jgi:hypothetical protein
MYLAEFAFPGTSELVNDLLIEASEVEAREFAQHHAAIWGVELFSLMQANEDQVRLYRLMRKTITLELPLN